MLKIKGKESDNIDEIDLRDSGDNVRVHINGECMAVFYGNGKFVFHGKSADKYEGKWNE